MGKITHMLIAGVWVQQQTPTRSGPSYLIVCHAGDWSGFRTLDECLAQNPDPACRRRDGSYWIEER